MNNNLNKCIAKTRRGEPCKSISMKNSKYCYSHSFGRFRGIPVSKNPTIQLIVGIIATVIVGFAFYIVGPSKENQAIIIKKLDEIRPEQSEKMPILTVKPIYFEPYHPTSPEIPGQFKAKIICQLTLKNKKLANNVRVKFDIDDGAGRRISTDEWNKISKQKPLVFSMTPSEVQEIQWTPDIPNAIKDIAKRRTSPFILRLLVVWEDTSGNRYKLKSYSELRYNEITNTYYFDERENIYIF